MGPEPQKRGKRDSTPLGAGFIYEAARKELDDQLAWIGDLDKKAGVLLGAVGVIFGLLFVRDSLLLEAPGWLGALVAASLGVSALFSVLAFHPREWETPGFDDLCNLIGKGDDTYVKWKALEDVQEAFRGNEKHLDAKATRLWIATWALLAALGLLGGYLLDQTGPVSGPLAIVVLIVLAGVLEVVVFRVSPGIASRLRPLRKKKQ